MQWQASRKWNMQDLDAASPATDKTRKRRLDAQRNNQVNWPILSFPTPISESHATCRAFRPTASWSFTSLDATKVNPRDESTLLKYFSTFRKAVLDWLAQLLRRSGSWRMAVLTRIQRNRGTGKCKRTRGRNKEFFH
jgi:hypothetical protein